MQIKKKDIDKVLISFVLFHIVIWTLIPGFSNLNLPLDTIEALAWGRELELGYSKHPPLSAWFVRFFYIIFGSNDWSYYFLSQIFIGLSFIIVYKFSEYFFENKIYCLFSVFLLEGIFFYNFTTPEFNVNISYLPFWSLTILYCWRGLKFNNNLDWLLFGLFAGFGIICKYSFVYLLIAIDIFFIYLIIKNKKFNLKWLLPLITFFAVLLPHVNWLIDNNYVSIQYSFFRADLDTHSFANHIVNPFLFLSKQTVLLIPFFIMFFLLIKKIKININFKDKNLIFLISVNLIPLLLVLMTSLFTGANIRTMWMTPFYLFFGTFFLYIYKVNINLKKINKFYFIFIFLLIFFPISYFLVSFFDETKRTDYPGKYVSQLVNESWKNNFSNKIDTVVGDEWFAGNLSYHLESRPKIIILKKGEDGINFLKSKKKGGILLIQPFNEIKKCPGVFFQISNLNDVCMVGK